MANDRSSQTIAPTKQVEKDPQIYALADSLKFAGVSPIIKGLIKNMIRVEGGSFVMGDSTKQNSLFQTYLEAPSHQVTISPFYIAKYEVTQKEWCAVMANNPSSYIGENLPVDNVSWSDCQEFISKLNEMTGMKFRMPTEAEWEFAAHGGNKSKNYKYSGSDSIESVAWYKNNGNGITHPVGMKQPNELGLYDMTGNVFEWCYDWFGFYESSPQQNPVGPVKGTMRVIRSGSFVNDSDQCRIFVRYGIGPKDHNRFQGIRLAY